MSLVDVDETDFAYRFEDLKRKPHIPTVDVGEGSFNKPVEFVHGVVIPGSAINGKDERNDLVNLNPAAWFQFPEKFSELVLRYGIDSSSYSKALSNSCRGLLKVCNKALM